MRICSNDTSRILRPAKSIARAQASASKRGNVPKEGQLTPSLVSECKFYGGEKLYLKTLDQLLGYLSWRHNYGIIISFCKQKNFTKVIEDAENIITTHPSYNSGFIRLTNSHFISKNILPTDDYKYVEIHHLYYNLFF